MGSMVGQQGKGGRLRLPYVGSQQTDNFEIALTSRERERQGCGQLRVSAHGVGLRAGRRMDDRM
jgi:hypothetical protein